MPGDLCRKHFVLDKTGGRWWFHCNGQHWQAEIRRAIKRAADSARRGKRFVPPHYAAPALETTLQNERRP